jgi:hypothetical protein
MPQTRTYIALYAHTILKVEHNHAPPQVPLHLTAILQCAFCGGEERGKKKHSRRQPRLYLRSSRSTTNPVCERRVDLLVCSLPLHRHSYVGFILAFASSIHNKQQPHLFPTVARSYAVGFSFLIKSNSFHYRRAAFSSMLKSRVGNILTKVAALRINLNLDGALISSKSHTHPSHSQTSRLLTTSLSLGVPVPRPTQCIRGV